MKPEPPFEPVVPSPRPLEQMRRRRQRVKKERAPIVSELSPEQAAELRARLEAMHARG